MSATIPFSFPALGGTLTFGPNGPVFTPSGAAPVALPQQPLTLPGLPNFNLPNLSNIPGMPPGGLPDLSALLPVLTPILSAAIPGIGPFLPVIGVLFQVAHALSTQMQATAASGTPNPSLQLVHDAFWQQVLGAFGQKPTTLAAAPTG